MKLQKYKEKDPKKTGIIVFTLICILLITGIFLYTSFASFETKEEFNIINGKVQDRGDLYFVFYVNNVISKTMPQKGDGYKINSEKTTCTNGASVEFNEINWSIKILNMTTTNTKCTLYFEKQNAAEYILAKGETDELKFDGTIDNNLRYVGANPNNYISFNNELWRIIGVMNNVIDEKEIKTSKLKIVRNESIGSYNWDISAVEVNNGYGINDWSQSYLMKLLNGNYETTDTSGSLYWNHSSGKCNVQNGPTHIAKDCDFTNIGLKDNYKNYIANVKWNTGGAGTTALSTIKTSDMYNLERSNNTGKICTSGIYCTDTFTRQTTWLGQIGLISVSDYGYATSGGSTTNREICLNKPLYDWKNYSECYQNNWLYKNLYQWTINPAPSKTNADLIIRIEPTGNISGEYYTNSNAFNIYPTLFLNDNVFIISGSGTVDDPYMLTN